MARSRPWEPSFSYRKALGPWLVLRHLGNDSSFVFPFSTGSESVLLGRLKILEENLYFAVKERICSEPLKRLEPKK